MKTYQRNLIFGLMAIAIIVLLFIILLPKDEMKNDTPDIKRFNNCIILERVPVRYITDDMIVEKCLPIELIEELEEK